MDLFGRVDVRFSEATSKLITNYIARQKLRNGEHLFGTFGKDGKMSGTVATWLIEADVKHGKVMGQTKTPGAINLLRHVYISEKIKDSQIEVLKIYLMDRKSLKNRNIKVVSLCCKILMEVAQSFTKWSEFC